ncbi:MAG TPA: AAA family ATPase [Campylobacterales bacterium]|nr:AAA family ATPase [Campylobacterales bacterium]
MMSLAIKYRPKSLDDMVGQRHLLSKNSVLRILIEKDAMQHSFFYGSTGCGKTTLAKVIAKTLQRPFFELNATTIKVEDIRKIFKTYINALEKPIIFIDEVHRLSKNQQEIGYPEARIPLAQLVIYLASSPKSNSAYNAINDTLKAIQDGEIYPIPPHIKTNAKNYLYPHDFGGWVQQSYLTKEMKFYHSSNIGFEKTLNDWVHKIKNITLSTL